MVRLPGWSGTVGADFSGYRIGGTNCANCRSLVVGTPPRCSSKKFVASEIDDDSSKAAGDDEIPVRSGDPADYCCNFWGLSAAAAKKASPTRAWAAKVRAGK